LGNLSAAVAVQISRLGGAARVDLRCSIRSARETVFTLAKSRSCGADEPEHNGALRFDDSSWAFNDSSTGFDDSSCAFRASTSRQRTAR
jgi:hypothetical protein